MTVSGGEVSFSEVTLDYRLYHDRTVTIFDTLLNLFGRRTSREWFRALDSVSFSIAPGESVALIGANGAGKSTALKLLAGIYLPTSGRVSAGGRIASLLDLGVGFHPELTGAENVYLNGALLGLTRSQMKDLLPEITRFSELERFMDTPVKYYSAGMFMRLGFGLATSVEPELLLIDEVLAVGDSSFQEKCYERIFGFRGSGRTIVFVSHDSEAVSRLCERAIWLDAGRIVMDGPVQDVLAEYLSSPARVRTAASVAPREWGTREVWFDSVRLTDSSGTVSHAFRPGESIVIEADITTRLPGKVDGVVFGFSIHRPDGETVIGVNNLELNQPLLAFEGRINATLKIDLEVLEPGNYILGLALTDPRRSRDYHWQDYCYPIVMLSERRDPPLKLRHASWE
jgi:ABC-type polysaccharide/polyol phosphate transport system ATPase subunit